MEWWSPVEPDGGLGQLPEGGSAPIPLPHHSITPPPPSSNEKGTLT